MLYTLGNQVYFFEPGAIVKGEPSIQTVRWATEDADQFLRLELTEDVLPKGIYDVVFEIEDTDTTLTNIDVSVALPTPRSISSATTGNLTTDLLLGTSTGWWASRHFL